MNAVTTHNNYGFDIDDFEWNVTIRFVCGQSGHLRTTLILSRIDDTELIVKSVLKSQRECGGWNQAYIDANAEIVEFLREKWLSRWVNDEAVTKFLTHLQSCFEFHANV